MSGMPADTAPATTGTPFPTLPTPSDSRRHGLLDIKVMLSTPIPTAGTEFAIYIQVTNPFDVPIWLKAPQAFLPKELKTVSRAKQASEAVRPLSFLLKEVAETGLPPEEEGIRRGIFSRRLRKAQPDRSMQEKLKYLAARSIEMDKQIKDLETQRIKLRAQIEQQTEGLLIKDKLVKMESEELKALTRQDTDLLMKSGDLRTQLSALRNELLILTDSVAIVSDKDLTLANLSLSKEIYVEAKGNIVIKSVPRETTVVDDSSLIIGEESLQPGNTAVYSLVLNTESNLLFRPVQYQLIYSINYTIDKKENPINTNSVAQSLSIRAPVKYVFAGASLGGMIGFVARFLQTLPPSVSPAVMFRDWLGILITLMLTVILSAMSVVFLARKSETQTMVSVEDFWGGLVIGFLIGYTGTTAFESLTGVNMGGITATPVPVP